jgi:hypothetical protein
VIWGNPWAWLGAAAVVVPVLIHMLGRRQARVLPFPTLRFLAASRLQPVRRTRVQDLTLLALRLLIVAFAVAALARPLFSTEARDDALAAMLSRVVIVDTSASMLRTSTDTTAAAVSAATADSETAAASARREAQRMANNAASSIVVETASPAASLAGAAAWLGTQPGPGEIVVVSDFQAGTLDAAAVARVPATFGLRLHSIGVAAAGGPVEITSLTGDTETVSRFTLTEDATSAEWFVRPVAEGSETVPLLLAGAGEAMAADAAFRAARYAGHDVRFGPDRPIAIVYEEYEGRDRLLRDALALDSPWMVQTLARLRDDDLLHTAGETLADIRDHGVPRAGAEGAAVTGGSGPGDAMTPGEPFVGVGHASDGSALALAARASIEGRDYLVFFAAIDPGGLAAAALIGSIGRALSSAPAVTEFEPAVTPEAVLAAWQRPPVDRAASGANTDASDGRWLWLVVLALLVAETVYRRSLRRSATGAVE